MNYNNQAKRSSANKREGSNSSIFNSFNNNVNSKNTNSNGNQSKANHIDFFSSLNGANGDVSNNNKTSDFTPKNGFSRPKMDNKQVNLFNNDKSNSYVEDIEEFSL